jgi:hypothetical protein
MNLITKGYALTRFAVTFRESSSGRDADFRPTNGVKRPRNAVISHNLAEP